MASERVELLRLLRDLVDDFEEFIVDIESLTAPLNSGNRVRARLLRLRTILWSMEQKEIADD